MKRAISVTIYGLGSLIGVVAFTYPLLLPEIERLASGAAETTTLRLADAPLLTTILLVVSLGLLLVELQGRTVNAKIVAALGMLVAVTSALRLLEMVIPGPGGFSFVFGPIILAGFVFGARFGFLMGTMTILASALITGGVGPWLPYQMYAAGWVGLTSGWLPRFRRDRLVLATLASFGFFWGVLFGLIINLYFWPFVAGEPGISWQPGIGPAEAAARYGAFYVATSLWWDVIRGFGNALVILALGLPAVRALSRFRDRFNFEWAYAR